MRRSSIIISVLIIGLAIGGIALATGGDNDDNIETTETDGASQDLAGFDDPVPFVGMPKNEAIARAESEGRLWRIGVEDGEAFVLTADLRPGRVTFEITNGVVTGAEIEVENTDPPPTGPPVFEDAGQGNLVADAVRRLVTDDNGFGGRAVFDEILVGTLIADDATRPLQSLDLELIATALSDIAPVRFIDDTAAEIQARFEAPPTSTAVVSVTDLLLLDDRAEVGMQLWCGSLCAVFLTYEAEPVPDGWSIIGTIGPIAMS